MPDNNFTLRKHQIQLRDMMQSIADQYKILGKLNKKQVVEQVFPGGGKSTHPIIAGKILIEAGIVDKICWVVPRKSLKMQGAQEFDKPYFKSIMPHGLRLREVENSADVDPSRGSDGFITTYSALSTAKSNNSRRQDSNHIEFRRNKYLLFLDECHHVTPDRHDREGYSYYQAIKPLYDLASFVILASGTMYRNEQQEIAFIDYQEKVIDGEQKAFPVIDIDYTHSDSIRDKANIPIFYNHCETELIKYTKNGQKFEKSKIENGDDRRVALTTEYGKAILECGLKSWQDYKLRVNPRSKLIIVASSQEECKIINNRLFRSNLSCALAISDEPEAQANIKRFREQATSQILVTCQMAYEGLDCKEATHIIVLTDIRSKGWLVQMLTRVMRADTHPDAIPYEKQYAVCFAPDDELMMKAIEDLRGRPDTSINKNTDDLEDLLNSLEVKQEIREIPEKPVFANMSSKMGGVFQTNPEGEELPAATRAKVELFQLKHNLTDPEIKTYNMLKALGKLDVLDEVSDVVIGVSNPLEDSVKTIREQEIDLRKILQKKASWLDHKFGFEDGDWNKRVHNKFRFKNRKDMNIDELNRCYEWMISEARRLAISMRDEQLEANESNMPDGTEWDQKEG